MMNLTQKQLDTLLYIRDQINANGYAPTAREIAAHFGVTETVAFERMNLLQHLGYIKRDFRKHRSSRVIRLPSYAYGGQ